MALRSMHKRRDPDAEKRRLADQQAELEESLKDIQVGDMSFAESLIPDDHGYKPITWTQLRRFFSYEKPAHGFKLSGDISQKQQDTWDRSKNIKVRDTDGVEGAVFFYDDDTEPYFSYEDVKVGNTIVIRSPRYHRFMDGQEGMRVDEAKNVERIVPRKYTDASRLDYGRLNKENGNKKFGKQQYEDAMSCYDAAIRHLEGTFYELPAVESEAKEIVAACYVNIAACHLVEKNWDAVEKPCRAALRFNASQVLNAKAHYRMGIAFLEQGNVTSASSSLQTALRLTPGDSLVLQGIERINVMRADAAEGQRALIATALGRGDDKRKAFSDKVNAEHARPFGYRRRLFGPPFDGKFDGICNFRDVGGLQFDDGSGKVSIIKRRILYRSANLSHCTSNDLETLLDELGIKTIVDLRHPREVQASAELQAKRKVKAQKFLQDTPPPTSESTEFEISAYSEAKVHAATIDFRHSFVPVTVKGAPAKICLPKASTGKMSEIVAGRVALQVDMASRAVYYLCSWWTLLKVVLIAIFFQVRNAARLMVESTALRVGVQEFYRTLLLKQGPEIAFVIETISDEKNHPVVICCSMGKDRTGIVVGLVLAAMGVPDDAIVSDYAKTSPALSAEMKQAQEQLGLSAEWNEASSATMKSFLTAVRREYGSVGGYLTSIGVSSSTLEKLRSALRETVESKKHD